MTADKTVRSNSMKIAVVLAAVLAVVCCAGIWVAYPENDSGADTAAIDASVRKLFDETRYSWRDLNVPEVDGRALHDIILEHKYKNALEIGTSTGYSGIWIAWALSKTGGKLMTIEIDPGRHGEAVANFRKAGLEKYVDARLGDAHEIVPKLEGPFDFVFCDADKEWYRNYLTATVEKIRPGGCFAAHNVFEETSRGGWGRGRGRGGMTGDYLEFARSFSFLDTKVLDIPGTGGLAVSYKKSEQ
jgi:caffeoyl-CoA O-methyltransferase